MNDPSSLDPAKLESLSPFHTALLAQAATVVLAETVAPNAPVDLPEPVLIGQIADRLAEHAPREEAEAQARALADALSRDDPQARDLVRAALGEILSHPALKDEIEEAYEARKQMQSVDVAAVAALALLALCLKIKSVETGPGGVKIRFDRIQADVLTALKALVGK